MAQRTDTFVAQEWTTLKWEKPNDNFAGESPISVGGAVGYNPLKVGVIKFDIPKDIKQRKIKEISLDFTYNAYFYPVGGNTGGGSILIFATAANSYEISPDNLDINTITWNYYKNNYFYLLGDSSNGGRSLSPITITITEFQDGKSGKVKETIWSQDKVPLDSIFYDGVYYLFEYDCIMITAAGGDLSVIPETVKLTIVSDDPDGTFDIFIQIPDDNSFIFRNKSNSFHWGLGKIDYIFSDTIQKKAILSIKPETGNAYNIEIDSKNTHYEFPANYFQPDNFTWNLSVTSENNINTTSETYHFTTNDYLSSAKAISPKSIIVDKNKSVVFKWEHNINSGTAQTKAELEYSDAEIISWIPLKIVDGESKETTILANTLPAGHLIWRVRTYNMDGVAGNWSQAAEIISRGSSSAPIITSIKAVPKLELEWQSDGQISAEVKIGNNIYKVYGNSKKFRSPIYLKDGSVEVSVRVLNEFDLWSEWSYEIVEIKNNFTGTIDLTAGIKNYSVVLNWNLAGESTYIYRNGELIGKTTGFTYTDYECVGKNEYYVMVGSTDGNYAKSLPVNTELLVPLALIKEKDSGEWITLEKKRRSYPSHKINSNMKTTYQFYAGRRLPVAYSPDNLTKSHTFDFSTKSRSLAEKIASLVGKEVVYKDCRGDIVLGVMDKITQTTDIATDINFQITETSEEVITYD